MPGFARIDILVYLVLGVIDQAKHMKDVQEGLECNLINVNTMDVVDPIEIILT